MADFAQDAAGFETVAAALDDFWTRGDGAVRDDRDQLDEAVDGRTVRYRDDRGNVVMVVQVVGSPGAYNVGSMEACSP